ncbi:MAG: T9SS type A sorting domain-containing protein [Bacteroidia bacterium]|nr:T9SS type A sorting domain-containing protein [Bacteroidia bacterium]
MVPNPSFENVISCPNGLGQIYLANNWENYGISPDLYCSCSPTGVSVPANNAGFQYANSGNCMAGMFNFRKQNSPNGPNAREFLGIQLSQPLIAGIQYYFSAKINFSGGPTTIVASNKFGMKLLTYDLDSSNSSNLITNTATIFSDSIVSDTLNWFNISGSFISDSAYTNLVLGNFFDDLNTDTLSVLPGFPDYSYYFIDDVCLSNDTFYCINWTYTHDNLESNPEISVFPNPTTEQIKIESPLTIKEVSIYNAFDSEILLHLVPNDVNVSVNLKNLKAGIYIIIIDFGTHKQRRKLIKL